MTIRDLINLKREPGKNRAPWLLKVRSSTGFIIGAVWMSTFTVCESLVLYSSKSPTETQLK